MIGMSMGLRLGARGGNRLAAYFSANGLRPQLAADFAGTSGSEGYMVGGAASTFAAMFPNFARSGNATMFDSDGTLKWAPHNLLTYSEDFTAGNWAKTDSTATGNTALAPDGTLTADTITGTATNGRALQSIPVIEGVPYTFSVWMKSPTESNVEVNIRSAGNGQARTVTPEWALYSITENAPATANRFPGVQGVDDGESVLVWGGHLYRSDLGGMADNPDRNDSYVPTTSAAVYMPRRNAHVYDGSSWVNRGVLIESAARTNLVTYSHDFSNAAWTKDRSTITANDANGPLGTNAATLVTGTEVSGQYTIYGTSITITSGTTYTISAAVKYTDKQWIWLRGERPNATCWSAFDIQNGVLGNRLAGVTDHGMEPLGDGWYLIWHTWTADANSSVANMVLTLGESDTPTDASVPQTGSFLLSHTQFEAAATPSSYIPTAGSTVTRAADSLPVPAANLPYDSSAMWMAMKGRMTYADTGAGSPVAFLDWEQAFNERILIDLRDNAGTGQIRFFQYDAASGADTVLSGGSVYSPGVNVPFSISSRHGSTYINGAVDGTALTEDTTPTALPDLSATAMTLGQTFSGYIENFVMGSGDPGDTGIEEAST